MADSIPSLRRKLDEAMKEIAVLRGQLAVKPDPVVKTVYVDREVRVPGPCRTEYVYVDREVPGPCRAEYIYVDRPVPGPIREIEVVKEVKSPPEVRVEYVDREVRVPDPVYVTRTVTEYVDNPAHLRMIEELQERLAEWQTISQSDL